MSGDWKLTPASQTEKRSGPDETPANRRGRPSRSNDRMWSNCRRNDVSGENCSCEHLHLQITQIKGITPSSRRCRPLPAGHKPGRHHFQHAGQTCACQSSRLEVTDGRPSLGLRRSRRVPHDAVSFGQVKFSSPGRHEAEFAPPLFERAHRHLSD